MNLKKVILSVLVVFFVVGCFMLSGFYFFKKAKVDVSTKNMSEYSAIQDKLWCVTFQLVWNELSEKFVKGTVNLVGGNPPIVDELNKKLYTADILSENSYYITWGKISKDLKKQIEKDIKKKFNETSDILGMINWNAKNSYLFYTMLKKNFTFIEPFDRLDSAPFNASKENVKYFGIQKSTNNEVRNNVAVLFYNSPDEYAVKLSTKENEDVILFRTNMEDTFENYFGYILKNSYMTKFSKKDIMLIPDIIVDELISYDELSGKQIEGTDFVISKAIQTIKFKLDNKGGSLKSEAALTVMKTAFRPEQETPRYFLFNKPFVLFLMEAGKEKPYYAMKIDNTDFLVKE